LLARSAMSIIPDNLLTGVGLGASALAMRDAFPDFPVSYQPPHVTLLVAFLEAGIFGGIFYLLLLTLPWINLFKQKLANTGPNVIAVAGLLLAVTLVGFFDHYTWTSNSGRLWQWLAWGLFATAQKKV
jgi:O-antigen ligase